MGNFVSHENAHGRPENLDPRVNGPYLDDIRKAQEDAYRQSRMKSNNNNAEAPVAEADDSTQELQLQFDLEENGDNNANGQ